MKEKIGISFVLLLALSTFVPPLFKEGSMFAVQGVEKVYGQLFVVQDYYFANVHFSLSYLFTSFTAIVFPFILPSMDKQIARISTAFGMWYFIGFVYEVIGLVIPDLILNSSEGYPLYFKCAAAFAMWLSITMTREIWIRTKKY
jgi:hypothetical protein